MKSAMAASGTGGTPLATGSSAKPGTFHGWRGMWFTTRASKPMQSKVIVHHHIAILLSMTTLEYMSDEEAAINPSLLGRILQATSPKLNLPLFSKHVVLQEPLLHSPGIPHQLLDNLPTDI